MISTNPLDYEDLLGEKNNKIEIIGFKKSVFQISENTPTHPSLT